MSEALLARVSAAQSALLEALAAQDLDAITANGNALAGMLAEANGLSSWPQSDAVRDQLHDALATADDIRARLNILADRNRRQLDRLMGLAGRSAAVAYGRSGRFR